MISNERQYRVSVSERDRLTQQLDELNRVIDSPQWIVDATRKALASQVLDIDDEIEEYRALQSADVADYSEVGDLSELPRALIRARIAAHLTQRDLADRLGLREQQVQRYEANEYAGASIGRLQEVMRALGVTFRGELGLPSGAGNSSALRARLASFGLNPPTIRRRFFGLDGSATPSGGWMSAAAKAARIFQSDVVDLLSSDDLHLEPNLASFKASAVANPQLVNGYARYAQYLAERLVAACKVPYRPLPSVDSIRQTHAADLERAPLETLLLLCWQHGIPVLPLADPGMFYGACWWVDGRPVIAMKHGFRSPDRWAFLLGHEMDHAQHPETPSVLEDELTAREWRQQPAEQAADRYATELLFGDSAEALVRVAVSNAEGNVARLKSVVPAVARAGNVSVGLLADHLAARVSDNGVNWWPAATNLHNLEHDAWQITRSYLFDFTDFSVLDGLDREILIDGIGP